VPVHETVIFGGAGRLAAGGQGLGHQDFCVEVL
jgi:hypothetical protein